MRGCESKPPLSLLTSRERNRRVNRRDLDGVGWEVVLGKARASRPVTSQTI